MPKNLKSYTKAVLFVALGSASAFALPALPASELVAGAVQEALSVAPAAQPVQQAKTPAQQQAATTQQAAARQLMNQTVAVARTGRSVIARATAYNSLAGQTDSTPNITATGTRTRPGVVALSRDLLRTFPYGTRIQLQDLSGGYNFGNQVFIVEDTMAARKTGSIDIWLPSYRQAIGFGARQVRITAVR